MALDGRRFTNQEQSRWDLDPLPLETVSINLNRILGGLRRPGPSPIIMMSTALIRGISVLGEV